MGIFDKKQSIPRRELLEVFRGSSGGIPKSGGRHYSRLEREKLVRETFGSKYGSNISKDDYRRAIRDLERREREVKNEAERRKLNERIEFLKELGGI